MPPSDNIYIYNDNDNVVMIFYLKYNLTVFAETK